jgi:hypothetical protein
MSGFAMLFFQHPSLLEFQRKMQQRRGRCNLETIFGVHEVPSDTQMREIVDGVPVALLRQALPELFEKVRRVGWAKEWKSTVPSGYHQGDYYTAMLDGSDYLDLREGNCEGSSQGAQLEFTLCTARSMPSKNAKYLLSCCFAVTEQL